MQEDETKLMKWVKFLSLSSETELMEMKSKTSDVDILKAFEVLEELRKDPAMREAALSREIALRDHLQYVDDAEQIGIERGKKIREHEIANQMKSEGLSVQLIAKITGLSIEEIEKL